jgi:hypothetical protein
MKVTNAADETVSISNCYLFLVQLLDHCTDCVPLYFYNLHAICHSIECCGSKRGFHHLGEYKIAGQNETCFMLTSDSFIQNMHNKLELELDSDSIFYKLGSSGLITFSDYIFLLTVLSSEYNSFLLFSFHYLSRLWSMFCVVKKLMFYSDLLV